VLASAAASLRRWFPLIAPTTRSDRPLRLAVRPRNDGFAPHRRAKNSDNGVRPDYSTNSRIFTRQQAILAPPDQCVLTGDCPPPALATLGPMTYLWAYDIGISDLAPSTVGRTVWA